MFKKQTTIVLGAGASIDHGFPLGQNLMTDIIEGLSAIHPWKDRVGDRTGLGYDGRDPSWLKLRYWNLLDMLSAQSGTSLQFNLETIEEFASRAKGQTAVSIDRFLRDNQTLSSIGRYSIAMEICARHWQSNSGYYSSQLVKRDYSIPSNLSWVRNLINRIREGAQNASELSDNKLTIVTFNYDVSLELSLDAQFDNTETHRGANWRECLKIFHVYGSVVTPSDKAFTRQQFLTDVENSAARIDVIGQTLNKEFSERLSQIRSAIASSERVIISGFSFDEANVELLRLQTDNIGKKLLVHNFNGDKGIDRVLDRLNVPTQSRFAPIASKEMTIAQADDEGLFRPD